MLASILASLRWQATRGRTAEREQFRSLSAAKVQLLFQLTIRFVKFNVKSLPGEYDVLRLQVAMSYSERVNIGYGMLQLVRLSTHR